MAAEAIATSDLFGPRRNRGDRKGRVAPATITGHFLATPRRKLQGCIGSIQLHLRKNKGSVITLKAIHNPLTTGECEGVTGLDQTMGRQIPERLGIGCSQGLLDLMPGEA